MNRTPKARKSAAALIIVSLMVVALSSPVAASDWKSYGTVQYYDYEYDAESVTWPTDDTVRVWTKDTVKGEEGVKYITKERQKRELPTDGYDNYLYTAHYVEFQCSSKQDRLLAMYDYNREGIALYAEEFPSSDWVSIVPGSQASQLFKIVCSANQRQ
ncbi:MAG: hypothetical protein HZB62_13960 [Nitrospirae bacterium]|nr:hypothetical protein [Nitrospirota bacterium]